MRILCISNMFPGPRDPDYGAFVSAMCNALAERGHDVEIAAIASRRRGPARTPAKYARLLAGAAPRARRADVVYAHYLVPTGAVAAACARASGRPLVLTAHGGDVALLSRGAARAAAIDALRQASAVVAVSRDLAVRLEEGVGDVGTPVSVVNMGVDLERFAPTDRDAARRRLGLPSGPLVIAVGGLTARKNPLGLLQALARVRERLPSARLAFVGDGPLAGAVDYAAWRLGLADAVHRAGVVPHARVPDWMAAADALAIVSRYEPLGQVALEALASGRPVVGTSEGGTPEVVPAAGPGRIVDPGDPAAIAKALLELLRRPPTPGQCRAAARPFALATQAERVEGVLLRAAFGES